MDLQPKNPEASMTHLTRDDAVRYIIQHARPNDQKELMSVVDCDALLFHIPEFVNAAKFFKLFTAADGEPIAFIAFHQTTPVSMNVSMISTPRWKEAVKPLLRWGLKYFKPMALNVGYCRVECRTIAGNSDAIWFLEGLGFRLECRVPDYGLDRDLIFLQYAWRLSDHVPLSPEDRDADPAPVAHEGGREGRG
jgi:hypothetical protein